MGRNRDLSTDPDNLAAMWRLAKPIYKELKQTGLSDLALAGILGNMAQECTFNPAAEYKGHFGYLQNTDDIVRWITKHFGGYGHTNQMNYMIAGLTRQLPQIDEGVWLQDRFNDYLNNVSSVKSVPQAVALWESAYEKAKGQNLRERINYGKYLYELILKEPEEPEELEGPVYSPNGEMSIYLKVSPPDEEEEQRPLSPYELVHLKLLQRQKNLPKIPYKAHKNGGRLIRRGLGGMQVIHDPNDPYNVAIVLEKDPLPEDYKEPDNIGKYGYVDITPLARMDETVLLLNQQVNPITLKLTPKNTYAPTPDTPKAVYQKPSWTSYLGIAPVALPIAVGAAATAPVWGPAAISTLSNPAFWIEAGKDLLTYTAADAASLGLTGKGLGAHVNNAIGLEEDHPVGELLSFGVTNPIRKFVSKEVLNLFEKKYLGNLEDYIALEVSNSFNPVNEGVGGYSTRTWYGTKFMQDNGKIRLRLDSHTASKPRELVLEPAGKDIFGVDLYRVHVRVWDGEKIPGKITAADRDKFLLMLYEELPDYAKIIAPESSPANPATRGALAAYRWIQRDPSFVIGKTDPELIVVPNKFNEPRYNVFYPIGKRLNYPEKTNKVFQKALEIGKNRAETYLGSPEHIKSLIEAGVESQEAKAIASQMRTNLDWVQEFKMDPSISPGEGWYSIGANLTNHTIYPTIGIGEPTSIVDLKPTIDAVLHEYGGHGATLAATNTHFSPETLKWLELIFPSFSKVQAHNEALLPERISILKNDALLPPGVKKQLEYLETVEEYSARTRAERMGATSDMGGYDLGFTPESVERLRKLIWSITPIGILTKLLTKKD